MTPGHGVLEGITRETVLEIASQLGYTAVTTNINRYDLYQADEVFLSSTAGGIIPVIEIDRRVIGNGSPGPITMQVQERYMDMLEKGYPWYTNLQIIPSYSSYDFRSSRIT